MEFKTAMLSVDKLYRYALTRIWDEDKALVTFIMLNPSTADHEVDDPTIRRCRNFAKAWGYGGINVCNLFPLRATKPEDLLLAEDPLGAYEATGHINMKCIEYLLQDTDKTIFAWGNTPILKKLFKKFPDYRPLPTLVQKAHYLELSKDGAPKHPLYLSGNCEPKPYSFHEIFSYL